jgi:putative zinc finger protein
MNCENYQDLLSDFIDGSLNPEDCQSIEAHLAGCGDCSEARADLSAIVDFCREHRCEYDAVPNEKAMWLRIMNIIEAETHLPLPVNVPASAGRWFRLMNHSWQLSFPQLAASVAGIILVVSLVTVVGMRQFSGSSFRSSGLTIGSNMLSMNDRIRQQQQVIDYWNQRVELNKARWNAQMRETFDRNMSVIDAAVNESLRHLNENPHDGVSEDILYAAMNDKVELLKEFSEL